MPCSKAARNANKISLPLLTLLALATSLVSTSSYADDRTTGRIQRVYIGEANQAVNELNQQTNAAQNQNIHQDESSRNRTKSQV
ncbi:hypothetical protein N9M41_07005, partial [Rhodopirellula sp.]|nr:hypothetical protein [Rhodopirellula sp.]